ncbi:MAG TPA: hypothetical protein VJX23_13210 [Candidatus Binataceae bacterium]|nr:hypothetical protein [Candidatus Binataceae bacterium]
MAAAEKGQRYARIFRKAGTFLGKGNIARAVRALKEGQALADELGDRAMAQRFAAEIAAAGGNPQSRE